MRTDLPNFATKQDLADLRLEIAERDASIYRWMVYGALFVNSLWQNPHGVRPAIHPG